MLAVLAGLCVAMSVSTRLLVHNGTSFCLLRPWDLAYTANLQSNLDALLFAWSLVPTRRKSIGRPGLNDRNLAR